LFIATFIEKHCTWPFKVKNDSKPVNYTKYAVIIFWLNKLVCWIMRMKQNHHRILCW